MKIDVGGPADVTGNVAGVLEREIRTCPVCGTKFTAVGASGVCPVCLLRGASWSGLDSSEPLDSASTPEHSSEERGPAALCRRFENYELMVDERGTPIQLGRGAMGITYKAFDVDLRCPVTLKVINERYVGEESARRRFLREARSAASLHHPNVASVFHLGRSGPDYFYAMEFVEGETLESLIKRSGRLDVKLALEITTQVASGLAAVHKEKLVHRDIKPTNIMASLEEGGAVTAKIIDLGLAKTVCEPSSQSAISESG
jgi:rubrerythrin